MKKKGKIARVGFDFDGVIAYNPLRVLRRPAMILLEKAGYERKKLHYPVPHSFISRWLWSMLHETSFFPSYGFSELKTILKSGQIQAYIVSGRYSFLKKAILNWLKRNDAIHLFNHIYINSLNEQPHLFKKRMIETLDLDYFVEDNWDIVSYLRKYLPKKSTEIHWIYNILDKNIPYTYKHPHIASFASYIKRHINYNN